MIVRRSGRKRKTNSLITSPDYQTSEEILKKKRLNNLAFSETRVLCQKLLTTLQQHKYAAPFNRPVDPILDGVPDYYEKIANPMDFKTIQDKLDASVYSNSEEFSEDVRLVFHNCWTYNLAGSEIVRRAKVLSSTFENLYAPIKEREKRMYFLILSQLSRNY